MKVSTVLDQIDIGNIALPVKPIVPVGNAPILLFLLRLFLV